MTSSGDGEMVAAQMEMMDKLQPYTYLTQFLGVVLAILIIRAGLALVKSQKGALKKSNQYACASLVVKGIILVLALLVFIPASNAMYEQMFSGIGASTSSAGQGIQAAKTMGAVGNVVGPVLGAVYPILALVFLNKEKIKSYLAEHGN
jgi:cytochrome bd-type quinol oxidase subunit 2